MDTTKSVGGLSQVVPQLTYDLIARLIPGILLMGLISILWSQEISSWSEVELSMIGDLWSLRNVPIILLVAYFLIQALETIWYAFVDEWMKGKSEEIERKTAETCLKGLKTQDPDFQADIYTFPDVSLIYDAIRLKNPIAGARIVKIRAEMQMYRNAALGVLVTFAAYLASVLFHSHLSWSLTEGVSVFGLLVAVPLLFFQANYRRKRLVWSLYNHWLLLFDQRVSVLQQP